jgi:hypothetical protein
MTVASIQSLISRVVISRVMTAAAKKMTSPHETKLKRCVLGALSLSEGYTAAELVV